MQPRPLVTRCHLLLPRWRLAQTMAAGWRGGPSQPQSLASADTYCPRITLRSYPTLGLFAGAVPLPGLSITCSTYPPGICTTVSFFRMHTVVTSCVSCLPPCPSFNFRTLSLNVHNGFDHRTGYCGTAGPPFSCPVECLILRTEICNVTRPSSSPPQCTWPHAERRIKIASLTAEIQPGNCCISPCLWAQILPPPQKKWGGVILYSYNHIICSGG